MRRTVLPLVLLLLTGTAAAASGHARASLGVSVRVTRSCQVAVSDRAVGVTCGTKRPAPVRVVVDEGLAMLRTLHVSPRSRRGVSTTVPLGQSAEGERVVTIDF